MEEKVYKGDQRDTKRAIKRERERNGHLNKIKMQENKKNVKYKRNEIWISEDDNCLYG